MERHWGNFNVFQVSKSLTKERSFDGIILPRKVLLELEKVVAFTAGSSARYVYFITDPDCPFCKEAAAILEKLLREGRLSIKVIFFPLEHIHPQAKAKSVSIFCDKKGFEGLKTGYLSGNQCREGLAKVESSIALMKKIGVMATPTFIFPDGEVKIGVLSPEAILSKFEKKN